MSKPSKTAAKAIAAGEKAKQARVSAPSKVSKPMRKLLDKNSRKAKNREARKAKSLSRELDV